MKKLLWDNSAVQVYIGCRASAFADVITSLVFLNITTQVNCNVSKLVVALIQIDIFMVGLGLDSYRPRRTSLLSIVYHRFTT